MSYLRRRAGPWCFAGPHWCRFAVVAGIRTLTIDFPDGAEIIEFRTEAEWLVGLGEFMPANHHARQNPLDILRDIPDGRGQPRRL